MKKLNEILAKWNFKKIAVWYVLIAVITGICCAGAIGYLYRDRINFALRYSQLKDAESIAELKDTALKTADASADVVDVLVADKNNQIVYSAQNSEFSVGQFNLVKADGEKKYLISNEHPNAAFQYVKSEEFMLNSIINKDFGEIRSDYDDDSMFESNLSSKTIYMISCVRSIDSGYKVYVINIPTTVRGGMLALKATAALAMLFFCLYWVLVALWLYNDAAKCRLSPLYWGIIGLLTNIIGLIVYKIYKKNMTICPACKTAQSVDHLYCSFCGTELGVKCKNCGCKISAKDNFCHQCGSKIQ